MFVIACTVAALAAAANWWSRLRESRAVEVWSKPVTTTAVIAIAAAAGAPAGVTAAAIVALVCCLIGDVALLFDRFVAGLAAFLVGHVAFAVMFVLAGLQSPTLAGIALVAIALGAAGIAPVILRGAAAKGLRRPVGAYMLVIAAMTVIGWATTNPWWPVGAGAFIVSDSFLGWATFVRRRQWMSLLIMVTYHLAIGCLAIGLTAV